MHKAACNCSEQVLKCLCLYILRYYSSYLNFFNTIPLLKLGEQHFSLSLQMSFLVLKLYIINFSPEHYFWGTLVISISLGNQLSSFCGGVNLFMQEGII